MNLMEYKDTNEREIIWDKFCMVKKMDRAACKRWFQRTMYSKITHMKSRQGSPQLRDRQNWLKTNLGFLHTLIVHHHSSKSAFKPACDATVSRLPDAGPSAEGSDQLPVGEPGKMELISVGKSCGLTEESLKLSGVSPTPSQTPSAPNLVQAPS